MHPKHDKRTGEDDVEDILHRVGDQVAATTGETCTLEDVGDVVPVNSPDLVSPPSLVRTEDRKRTS